MNFSLTSRTPNPKPGLFGLFHKHARKSCDVASLETLCLKLTEVCSGWWQTTEPWMLVSPGPQTTFRVRNQLASRCKILNFPFDGSWWQWLSRQILTVDQTLLVGPETTFKERNHLTNVVILVTYPFKFCFNDIRHHILTIPGDLSRRRSIRGSTGHSADSLIDWLGSGFLCLSVCSQDVVLYWMQPSAGENISVCRSVFTRKTIPNHFWYSIFSLFLFPLKKVWISVLFFVILCYADNCMTFRSSLPTSQCYEAGVSWLWVDLGGVFHSEPLTPYSTLVCLYRGLQSNGEGLTLKTEVCFRHAVYLPTLHDSWLGGDPNQRDWYFLPH